MRARQQAGYTALTYAAGRGSWQSVMALLSTPGINVNLWTKVMRGVATLVVA